MYRMICISLLLAMNSVIAVAQNVGINMTNPVHARLEINGSVGASVGMFGADKAGVTISANNPEAGFNYFYNNGQYTMKAGYASYMGMYPASGDLYIGNFNGNQSAVDFGTIGGARDAMIIRQNGNVGIGTNNIGYPLTVQSLPGGQGLIQESIDGSVQVGFWVSSSGAYLQTWSNTALDFATNNGSSRMTLQTSGDLSIHQSLDITQQLNTPATGTTNLLPLAYGKVNSPGTVFSATPNVTITRVAEGDFNIAISSEPDMYANAEKYIVVLTPAGGGGVVTYIMKPSNVIGITTWTSAISYNNDFCGLCDTHSVITSAYAERKSDNSFSFLVYKIQ
jgi:hypothetical protein